MSNNPNFPHHLYRHILELTSPTKREVALFELSKKREEFPDIAPILWHSYGTIAALLQEIVSIYPLLSPPALTPGVSNRCCNALALLQCVAAHSETRSLFLNSHLGLFLYPFLNTICSQRQYEYLRLTSLGVIGALVKMDDPEVISFLLQTEIIPLCLRIMDNGSKLSKTVATFIIQKILLDDMGLSYICATFERFSTVSSVLSKMVDGLPERDRSSNRLLKHIVRCYLRLSNNTRARDALRNCLPARLRDGTFVPLIKDDIVTSKWLNELLVTVGGQNNNIPPLNQNIPPQQQGQQPQAPNNNPNMNQPPPPPSHTNQHANQIHQQQYVGPNGGMSVGNPNQQPAHVNQPPPQHVNQYNMVPQQHYSQHQQQHQQPQQHGQWQHQR